MRKLLVIALTGFTLLLVPGCSSLLKPELREYADLEREILREVNENQIASLAAWVVRDDSIVWQEYFSYADVANQRAADSTTIYGLASV